MKATEATFLQFLKKSPQFVIPIYQRTYSWTETECHQLWDDILRAGSNDEVNAHFVVSFEPIHFVFQTYIFSQVGSWRHLRGFSLPHNFSRHFGAVFAGLVDWPATANAIISAAILFVWFSERAKVRASFLPQFFS